MAEKEALRTWASENRYCVRFVNAIPLELVGRGIRMFFGTLAGASVFYVVLEHQNGRSRRGWVLCPDSLLSRRAKRVKVRWDETISESLAWEQLAAESPRPASPAARHPEIDTLWDRDLDG
jgi:hypothetical protein